MGSEFAQPVDHVELGLTDYLDVVKKPMDLGTLKRNLKDQRYTYYYEFVQDMDRIWTNCMLYNGPGSPYHDFARDAKQFADKRLCQLQAVPMTLAQHAAIVSDNFERLALDRIRPLTASEIQILADRLGALTDRQRALCIYYYLSRKGVSPEEMTADRTFTIDFDRDDPLILRDLMCRVVEVKEM